MAIFTDIIRELWYGNVSPFEQCTRGDKQLKELLKRRKRIEKGLPRGSPNNIYMISKLMIRCETIITFNIKFSSLYMFIYFSSCSKKHVSIDKIILLLYNIVITMKEIRNKKMHLIK